MLFSIPAVLLLGCGQKAEMLHGDGGSESGGDGDGDDTGSSGGDVGSSDGDGCGVEITTTTPADGETAADHRAAVEITLSEADSSAMITLIDSGGGTVSGVQTFSDLGNTVRFAPSVPLLPNSEYTAEITYCGGAPSISFFTSDLGSPVDCDLTGGTFAFNISGDRYVKPAGAGPLLFGDALNSVLLGVSSVGAA